MITSLGQTVANSSHDTAYPTARRTRLHATGHPEAPCLASSTGGIFWSRTLLKSLHILGLGAPLITASHGNFGLWLGCTRSVMRHAGCAIPHHDEPGVAILFLAHPVLSSARLRARVLLLSPLDAPLASLLPAGQGAILVASKARSAQEKTSAAVRTDDLIDDHRLGTVPTRDRGRCVAWCETLDNSGAPRRDSYWTSVPLNDLRGRCSSAGPFSIAFPPRAAPQQRTPPQRFKPSLPGTIERSSSIDSHPCRNLHPCVPSMGETIHASRATRNVRNT